MSTATPSNSIPGLTMFEHFTIGRLCVLIDAATGAVVAVQDAKTGCAASLMYCKREIADAIAAATHAWQSTADFA